MNINYPVMLEKVYLLKKSLKKVGKGENNLFDYNILIQI